MEHFMEITSIPRCSYHAEKMQEYIKTFALGLDYEVFEDEYGNVLCRKGEPKICLQAHYDMVCIGDTSSIELVREHNILKAKNSTLGADNGMGMALMFKAMEENDALECLFTADEEVGLIGASHFKMPLVSTRLLNLDSEEEGEICIGCAGGVDVVSLLNLTYEPLSEHEIIYEISATDFPGGHSGVDIDKNIPSAIKVLARELAQQNVKLISITGGERRNSIPKSATAFVASSEPFTLHDERLDVKLSHTLKTRKSIHHSELIIKALDAFAQGVREWDRALNIPSTSINLGVVSIEDDILRLDCSLRAMDDQSLDILAGQSVSFFEMAGFAVRQEGFHEAWKPEIGPFTARVKIAMEKVYETVPYRAIHAGLECGVLIASQTKAIEAVSIGPTIHYPHSLREECDLDSVEKISRILKEIIKG